MSASGFVLATVESALRYCNSCGWSAGPTVTAATALQGGVANYVYRLTLSSNETVVLKHYPPFLASANNVPISQDRYRVEREALVLVEASGITESSRVRVPKVIFHDDEACVIVMEDAGNHPSLLDYFKTSNQSRYKGDIAQELVAFLAKLNALPLSDHQQEVFQNQAAWTVLNQHLCSSFIAKAQAFQIPELSEWADKVVPFAPCGKHLVFGDLWPNSVHVDSESSTLWLLDWEMTRFCDATRDVRQMIANLWIMEQTEADLFRNADVTHFRHALLQQHRSQHADSSMFDSDEAKLRFLMLVIMFFDSATWGLQQQHLKQLAERAVRDVHTVFTSQHQNGG